MLHGDGKDRPPSGIPDRSAQGDCFMHPMTRRQLLQTAGAGAAALVLAPLTARSQQGNRLYELPALPYAYDALEPHIDAETMKIHHDLHHKTYVDNLNKELSKYPELVGQPIDQLLRNLEKVPQASRQAIINNGGGHANHTMFWQIMK